MKTFAIPTREQVTPENQAIFDTLTKVVGRVPNLFAVFATSDHALANYITLSNGKTSLRAKEKEAVNLIVSQVNDCAYCSAAHTAIAKMNGFNDDQIVEIRGGSASFDAKIDALVKVAKSITENKGHADHQLVENFYAAGYTQANLIDVAVAVGDKTITNYVYALTEVPVDWPAIPELVK
ncbi:carboxymuconolactone decarboxylase family protein [Mucilaginibacter sp. P25]|uniref:Alkylhydroperoxidase AhpD family core domain-containing protein n=1 Tax=Mucilaginibacter gossypii TaxID=551996 RepID=A0A1G7N181_9SPHI|nr:MULTISPECIES: carboxymuconolactone decarboxylase family protein [Mucilaginibacter]QTE39465.1 carboxymuconolactone decarboxylase family protein [Mucilaginibacter gossypii]RAV56172.1 carboxymuconolactone decarboxylase family protein [Mucilaginibacter rubeus]SDF67774.1 alkylhydroperoxidase AhpD family core domain-containing protein [Mucilaginibacter gossypii]